MKILSLSSANIWPFGKNKGIPSIYASQKGLVDRGHEVHFLCPLKRKEWPLEETYDGIHITRFRLPFDMSSFSTFDLPVNNFWSWIRIYFLYNLEWFFLQIYFLVWGIKIARRIKPDIIYVHGLTPAFCGYFLKHFFKSKLIVRVYGVRDLNWKFQKFWYRIKECRDYLAFKVPADYFIITLDGTGGDHLAGQMGVPKEKIKMWRNGVNFDIYNPDPQARNEILKEFNIRPKTKIIISASRLIPFKGVEKLIHALPELFKKGMNYICIIAGHGPKKNKLEKLVKEYGIESTVVFAGTLPKDKLNKILNAADIFVSLSPYSNCSNSLWEAMVCGKCIVTIENESIKEALTSYENGILVPQDHLDTLPGILEELFKNDGLRQKLSTNVRQRANEILQPWPQRINREVDLLEELVDR